MAPWVWFQAFPLVVHNSLWTPAPEDLKHSSSFHTFASRYMWYKHTHTYTFIDIHTHTFTHIYTNIFKLYVKHRELFFGNVAWPNRSITILYRRGYISNICSSAAFSINCHDLVLFHLITLLSPFWKTLKSYSHIQMNAGLSLMCSKNPWVLQ